MVAQVRYEVTDSCSLNDPDYEGSPWESIRATNPENAALRYQKKFLGDLGPAVLKILVRLPGEETTTHVKLRGVVSWSVV